MGSDAYVAQHQQRPSAVEGARFKDRWFRYYRREAGNLVLMLPIGQRHVVNPAACRRFMTVDLAASLKTSADYTVIGVWADDCQGNLILLDLVRDRIEQHRIIEEIWRLFREHRCLFVGIESVGSQLLFVQAARVQGLPVQELRADRDKVSRSIPATIRMEAGQVWFPESAPWLDALRKELLEFPHGSKDDIVDCTSYAVQQMLLFYDSGRIHGELVTSAELPPERAPFPTDYTPGLPAGATVQPDGLTLIPGKVWTSERQANEIDEAIRRICSEDDDEDRGNEWWR
jgi:predicted phage terminase large subunit-like protein